MAIIDSRKDYLYYLECDRIALNIPPKLRFREYYFDEIYQFERLLRKSEYYRNCRKDFIGELYRKVVDFKLIKKGIKLGFTIPINVFGPGLSIAHYGTIIINEYARVGCNCRIHAGVNIGTKAGAGTINYAPIIGNNVYIGPGVKMFGDIRISDGIAIGANAVVNKSFEQENITIAGVPAKKISDKGSEGLLIKAAEIVKQKENNN